MDTREKFISLIKNSPMEKLKPVFELVADELITAPVSEKPLRETTGSRIEKSGYILFEYNINADMAIVKGENIQLSFRGRPVEVSITDDTLVPKSYILANEKLFVIGKVNGDSCTAKVIANKEFYDMFMAFGTLEEKTTAMQRFSNLSVDVQENIRNELSGRLNPITHSTTKGLTRVADLRFKFDMCRHTYTPQQQMDIEAMFENQSRGSSSTKDRALRGLMYILNINQSTTDDINYTKTELKRKVSKYIYKQEKVVDKMVETIIASKYSTSKGCAILLVGPPGVGKTAVPRAIAKVLNIPFFKIPLGSCSSIVDVVGDAPHYDASDCGEPVKDFYKAGTTRVLMLLDEYDKAYEGSGKDAGKASKPFNDALSDEHCFKDAFIGTFINTENTIWVATANSTEGIAEHLLNRMTIIYIDEYSLDEKIEIAQNYIMPEILSNFNIDGFSVTISNEVVKYIIDNFCVDDGVRDVKKHLESIVDNIVSSLDEEGHFHDVEITCKLVNEVLNRYVDADNPEIIYRRNKHLYSPKVATEIKAIIAKLHREDIDSDLRIKAQKKLEYLVHAVPLGDAFTNFDKDDFFDKVNATHFGQLKAKKEIAQALNISAVNGQAITNNRFLFVGDYGIGKSSLVKSIANASNAGYYKISFNGISDENTIKGHSETYIGADAGLIVKGIRSLKTTKGVIHLDEVDKMGNHNGVPVSNTLVDLLDDSSEYTDHFLGVPINLSNVLFIATCNDLSAVDPVIRDRFTIIYLDGYSKEEKGQIIENYVIPKTIKELCPNTLKLSFTPEAISLVKSSYCLSFGVRDADKVVRKLIKDKLYTLKNERVAKIGVRDVQRVLGNPPAQRGNFPETVYPGLSKGLAVTGDNVGMAFAIETVLVPNESSITITGLPKESTIDSVKLAITYIKCNYPGLLDNKGIHLHFAEGSVQKDGPSAGVAILMSILSAGLKETIKENVAYTGEINANGYVFNIGGTKEKIQGAQESGCTKVFIPYGNYTEFDKEEFKLFSVEVVPVKHISEVIECVFPELNKKIA